MAAVASVPAAAAAACWEHEFTGKRRGWRGCIYLIRWEKGSGNWVNEEAVLRLRLVSRGARLTLGYRGCARWCASVIDGWVSGGNKMHGGCRISTV